VDQLDPLRAELRRERRILRGGTAERPFFKKRKGNATMGIPKREAERRTVATERQSRVLALGKR